MTVVKARSGAIDNKTWERLSHKGVSLKQQLLGKLPDSAAPFGETMWQSFKEHCAAEGNILPLLIAQAEPQRSGFGMFRRRGPRKPTGSRPFDDLPLPQRLKAEAEFTRLCERWGVDLPSWRRAILMGVARRLVLDPPDSAWGKRMRRIKGGVYCQRKYRQEGSHPLARFNQAMAKRQRGSGALRGSPGRECETLKTPAEEARERLGVTAVQMRGVPRIAPLVESCQGGIEQIIEALRWSPDTAALAFLKRYDSVPRADLKHLSIEEISIAAGLDPRQLFLLAADSMVYLSLAKAKLQLFSNLPDITKAMVRNALSDTGSRDRRHAFLVSGLLPIPAGSTPPPLALHARSNRGRAAPKSAPSGCIACDPAMPRHEIAQKS